MISRNATSELSWECAAREFTVFHSLSLFRPIYRHRPAGIGTGRKAVRNKKMDEVKLRLLNLYGQLRENFVLSRIA